MEYPDYPREKEIVDRFSREILNYLDGSEARKERHYDDLIQSGYLRRLVNLMFVGETDENNEILLVDNDDRLNFENAFYGLSNWMRREFGRQNRLNFYYSLLWRLLVKSIKAVFLRYGFSVSVYGEDVFTDEGNTNSIIIRID